MITKFKFLIFSLLSLSSQILNAQDDASKTLKAVYGKLDKVSDYSVKAHIKVDMPLIKILPVNVQIYFKQKDKFKVKSKGIAIVPRQGFDQISKVIRDPSTYTAVQQGFENLDGKQTAIINVIPLSDTSDLILGKLWIDKEQNVILKSQLTTRTNGTIVMDYTYKSQLEFGLPDQMVFFVDMKKFKIPKNIGATNSSQPSDDQNKKNKEKIGKIIITFSDYQVNKGIPDNVFK
jgi:outer membrane lipoprotein-sorting protein